ncbi:hypothetical protein BASA81_010025 [Batrachochytrium salamandrivorans]|nr:hypothetical protein BASA81_010025 [Batrachochytrium salamandrivorans]
MSLSLVTKAFEGEITKKLGGKTSVLGNAISVAKLFVSVGHEWKDTEIMGALVFCQDRETKCQFVRIYDLKSLALRFQAEVSYEPVYQVESEFFHTLELENIVVGFMHSHGTVMPSSVPSQSSITEAKRFASAITRFSQGQQELKEAKQLFQASAPQQGGRRRGSSAWNMFKSTIGMGGEQKPGQGASSVVGTPMNFVHVSHVGINPDGTMDVNQCPAEWKQHLKDAGVKKKDMLNPEFNKQVVKTLNVLAPLGGGGGGSFTQEASTTALNGGSSSSAPAKMVTVKYDFTASDQKQLSVSAGQTLMIIKEYGDGWSKATRVSDSKVGMVPSNYLDYSTAVPASEVGARPPSQGMPPRSTPAAAPAAVPAAAPTVTPGMPPMPRPVSRAPPPRQQQPQPQQRVPEPVPEPEPEVYTPEPEREATPPPKPVNPLLAGISSFNRDGLSKAEPVINKTPSNPLLDSIKAGQSLKKVEVVEKKSAPNLLDSIKAGPNLKKVETPDPAKKPPVPAAHAEPTLGNLFSDALAKIRSDIIGDDDDDGNDSDGSDWD